MLRRHIDPPQRIAHNRRALCPLRNRSREPARSFLHLTTMHVSDQKLVHHHRQSTATYPIPLLCQPCEVQEPRESAVPSRWLKTETLKWSLTLCKSGNSIRMATLFIVTLREPIL